MTSSAFVRLALQQALGQSSTASVPSAAAPDDAWELLLARCPADVQVAIRQAVAGTGVPLGKVLRALVVAACQPKTMGQPSTSPEPWHIMGQREGASERTPYAHVACAHRYIGCELHL
jgi:hypothetical protein